LQAFLAEVARHPRLQLVTAESDFDVERLLALLVHRHSAQR
jgi:hypothetical protein